MIRCPIMSDVGQFRQPELRPNIGQLQRRKNLLIYNWASFQC